MTEDLNPSTLYGDLLRMTSNPSAPPLMMSKARCKRAGIKWAFVENSVAILGLKMEKAGPHGYCISRK